MSTSVRRTLGTLALIVAVLPRLGASDDLSSPVGAWKTIDDKTGKALSIVRVYEQDGQLFAKVERILTPGDENRTCTRCTDDRKDQPVVGLVFMRHMKLVDGVYRNGDILDPENGTVYRCRMQLEDGGRKLRVRGFVGMSWFGRSQVWQREP